MTRIAILDAMYGVIADLRVARALVNDQVRGTNDRKYELVKDFDRTIERGERAYKELRNQLP